LAFSAGRAATRGHLKWNYGKSVRLRHALPKREGGSADINALPRCAVATAERTRLARLFGVPKGIDHLGFCRVIGSNAAGNPVSLDIMFRECRSRHLRPILRNGRRAATVRTDPPALRNVDYFDFSSGFACGSGPGLAISSASTARSLLSSITM
jgi:hypothetical protein